MGEHKLREGDGNGDREKPALSTHLVEAVCICDSGKLAGAVEDAYTRLARRAKDDDSFIVGVVQAMSTVFDGEDIYYTVLLTAQRISREEIERQQRMAQFGGGPRR